MPKYKCTNKDCVDYDIIKTEISITAKWINGELITVEQYCPKCNTYREHVRDHTGFCTNMRGNNVCIK
jgi:hypothetical protein